MGAVRHTPQTRARVLRHFAVNGRIDLACEAAGVDRTMHYDWLKKYPDYAARFELARERAADLLEAEAWRRAREGVQEPVFSHGKRAADFVIDPETGKPKIDPETGKPVAVPAFVRRYSDQLLMFLLKGRRREVYGDKLDANIRDIDKIRDWMKDQPDEEE